MITLLNRKKNLNQLFQTGDFVYGEGFVNLSLFIVKLKS
jgi:hypothetical protein